MQGGATYDARMRNLRTYFGILIRRWVSVALFMISAVAGTITTVTASSFPSWIKVGQWEFNVWFLLGIMFLFLAQYRVWDEMRQERDKSLEALDAALTPPGVLLADPLNRAWATRPELAHTHVVDRRFRLVDVPHEAGVIRNKTFERCLLYGPVILGLYGINRFEGSNSLAIGLTNVEWHLTEAPEGTTKAGMVGLDGCLFMNCQFHDVGFWGTKRNIDALRYPGGKQPKPPMDHLPPTKKRQKRKH